MCFSFGAECVAVKMLHKVRAASAWPAQLLLQLLLALRVCVAILLLQDCIKHSRSLRDGLPVSEKPLRGELLPMYAAHVCVALPIRLHPRVSKEYRLTHLLYHQVPKF